MTNTNTPNNIPTVVEFLTMVKETCEEFPTNRNPRRYDEGGDQGGVGCAYRTHTEETGERNCLIGHVLIHKMGLTYSPAWEGKEASEVLQYERITRAYGSSLSSAADHLQVLADDVEDTDEDTRTPWGQAWAEYTRIHPFWADGDLSAYDTREDY